MVIELVTQYQPYVDELFTAESKKGILTNQDLTWTGAHTVKVYKVGTAAMQDYGRSGAAEGNWSRYGSVGSLEATTEEFTLSKDRSFTFVIDALDSEETGGALAAASALARQVREVVIPEVDTYTYSRMIAGAGFKPAKDSDKVTLTAANIYGEIIKASTALDDEDIPDTERVLVVTPAVYQLMKESDDIIMNTDIGADMRLKGIISNLDGMQVVKVSANRLPKTFQFMLAHPSATVAPVKLEDYRTHSNPPGINGDLVEGRICYDAFVLENKKKGIYYMERPLTAEEQKAAEQTA
nr:MAG TPA: major capsid protein [Caudoviricetes sp.]